MNIINKNRQEKGITLIALVVTIIILIILAGVSVNLVLGDNGIIEKAKEAKFKQERATVIDNAKLGLVEKQLDDINGSISLTDAQIEGVLSKYGTVNKNEDGSIKSITPEGKDYEIPLSEIWDGTIVEAFNKTTKVNVPVLVSGMTPIKFTMPTEESMGEVVKTNTSDAEWYNYGETYETRKWANAQTEDGSMWVWIPRYAYKIDSENQTIDVKFLIGQTDNYYNEDGTIGTAQRQTEVDQTIDTSLDYTVHPAFTDESKINFANGGWDSELTGIWVAKFEAGYASGNNDAPVVASNVNYYNYNNEVFVSAVERPRNEDGTQKSSGSELPRNWLDGIYGNTVTSIKYPVFQGTTYSMNYISHSDSYDIAKALTDNGNIYGFSNANADSHLMKNSEWGAIAYLSQSKYGQNGTEITINNVSLNSGGNARIETAGKTGVDSVYAVTGCTSNETDREEIITTIEKINKVSKNIPTTDTHGVYVWNQKNGQNASTTGTIYGIYDMSGGMLERVSAYVTNGHVRLKAYGESITYDKDALKMQNTKYTMAYANDEIYDNKDLGYSQEILDKASQENFAKNTKIYGDAVRETASSNAGTSNAGWGESSWNNDYSIFPGNASPFLYRGGKWSNHIYSGTFAFFRHYGAANTTDGFRAVVVPTI